MIIFSCFCICFISIHAYKSENKTHSKRKFSILSIGGFILSILLLTFSTIWLTSIWIYSKPLKYEQLIKYGVVVPPGTQMTVPMPENIEDTILMFFHRSDYIKKYGERIEKQKEPDLEIKKRWNEREKENVTLFNSSRKNGLQPNIKK